VARQSEALASETAVMRQFDRAMQNASDLGGRARERVLRYVADQVAEQLGYGGNGTATTVGGVTAAGGVAWGGPGGGSSASAAGGGSSTAGISGGGPGGGRS
jgi:hypothetical protein